MKRILGLDLGTTSIGWALVDEDKEYNKSSKIIKTGVRVIPLTVDEKINFEGGKPITTNAERTLKRGARRNLDRYQLRRKELIKILTKHQIISESSILTESGKNTTHSTLSLRAKSATEKIELYEFARVLLTINKKRGYKSSRKTNNEEDGVALDGMSVAKYLYDNNITPGQYAFKIIKDNKKYIPEFYPSDLKAEFEKIWNTQSQFYNTILTPELFNDLQGKNKGQTWKICEKPFRIEGITLQGNRDEQKYIRYQLRVKGLESQLNLEELAIVLQEINNDLNKTSGYLGNISDRSKTLYTNKLTVGQYLWEQISKNPHTSLKNQVFYRQDYLDEFETIWTTQSKYYDILSNDLKKDIRDIIIFYQRPLKSQKALLNYCQFESKEISYFDEIKQKEKKRIIGPRVIPKSSPLFQAFKIWQNINDLVFLPKNDNDVVKKSLKKDNENNKVIFKLDEDARDILFNEANLRGNLSKAQIFKVLGLKSKEWDLNFDELKGNTTNSKFFNVFQEIAKREGYGEEWEKKTAIEIKEELTAILPEMGISPDVLYFDSDLNNEEIQNQISYALWHLLYAATDDTKVSKEDRLKYGNTDVNLKKNLHLKFGFKPEYTSLLCNMKLEKDYGNLSAKAIKKILPHLKDGLDFYDASKEAGYNHSNSLTKEENENRILKNKLEILSKNSLRNPVVEKILNQMINLINQVIENYGKPEEIRIELARELKKSASERAEMTKLINANTKANLDIAKLIQQEFGFTPTKNDIIRYKLWEELKPLGHKDVFTNTYIQKEKLFSKEIDIEHILPKALIYDDSFSNKTLAFREVNLKKANRTAIDFITQDYNTELENYTERVKTLFNNKKGTISNGKYQKLLKPSSEINEGFIKRDLRNSQYIAKQARKILLETFKIVTPTTGKITDKLRQDWDLINVMKELNFSKYKALGLTYTEKRKHNKEVEKITDWTKRNDHRHHAMDALVVAFTSNSHIQYINNLNARKNTEHKNHNTIIGIENKITTLHKEENGKNKRLFTPPMENFRSEAKKQLSEILVSFKAKNKVATININKTKYKGGYHKTKALTPRGQLHKETVYGKIKIPAKKPLKINKRFTLEDAQQIINKEHKTLILNHLKNFNNEPELAFDTKTLKKHPLIYKNEPLKEVKIFEEQLTIRKEIAPDLKIDKVIDEKVKQILITRKKEFNGDAKKAFSDLDKNPIYLNKEKNITIKRVTITGVNNAEPLHYKKDHFGNYILDKNDNKIPVDYVSLGNNHHVAIYEDSNGKLQEKVVSLFEAVTRKTQNLPVIDIEYNTHLGWQFKFSMKQNEMFVFPSDDFNPNEIDLLDEKNYKLIAPRVFRVQKISSKNYLFAHIYESNAISNDDLKNKKTLSDKSYYFIQSTEPLRNIIKVRINHIGQIVHIGEY